MLSYGFYNSVSGDRTYNAEQFASIFDGIIEDGVFANIGDKFAVSPNGGSVVLVKSGRAWFDHTWTLNDAPIPLDCGDAPLAVNYHRWDAVVLEVNQNTRVNSIKVVNGGDASPSATAAYPAMVDEAGIHQHPLAYVHRYQGTDIRANDIIITVGTDETKYVTAPLQTISIEEQYARWDALFADMMEDERQVFVTWLEGIQDMLDDDQAAALARRISLLETKTDNTDSVISNLKQWTRVSVTQHTTATSKTVNRVDAYKNDRLGLLKILFWTEGKTNGTSLVAGQPLLKINDSSLYPVYPSSNPSTLWRPNWAVTKPSQANVNAVWVGEGNRIGTTTVSGTVVIVSTDVPIFLDTDGYLRVSYAFTCTNIKAELTIPYSMADIPTQ